jgi:hypothetical protein
MSAHVFMQESLARGEALPPNLRVSVGPDFIFVTEKRRIRVL